MPTEKPQPVIRLRYHAPHVMEEELIANYPEAFAQVSLRKRYAKILVARAIKEFLDRRLDTPMVMEDLYDDIYDNEEGLTPKQARKKGITDRYPNLTHSEKDLGLAV